MSFSLVGDGLAPIGGRATRRERANAALIRHRQRPIPANIQRGTFKVWEAYVAWRLEWENAIYNYRDGNIGAKGQDDD